MNTKMFTGEKPGIVKVPFSSNGQACANSLCSKLTEQRCTGCRSAYFCSKECQRLLWKTHKKSCKLKIQSPKTKHCNNADDESGRRTSEVCDNPECLEVTEKKCTGCQSAYFCSKRCQRLAWKMHKESCKKKMVMPQTHNYLDDEVPHMVVLLEKLGGGFPFLPSYHVEYSRKHPSDTYGVRILQKSYILNQLLASFKDFGQFNKILVNYGVLLQVLGKRWGSMSDKLLHFLASNPAPGTIFKDQTTLQNTQRYGHSLTNSGRSRNLFHTFRNTPVHNEIFERGKCYVSVGFVDLQQVLVGTISGDEGCVEWYGYDASKICVARAKLILHLLLSDHCSTEDILQVWFSSCISSQAQRAIEKSCEILLSNEADADTKLILQCWAKCRISTKNARSRFQENRSTSTLETLMKLKKEKERVDYCHYLLTGEMFLNNSTKELFGNSTMFNLPEKFDDCFKEEENIFYTINLSDVSCKLDLFEGVQEFFARKVKVLKESLKKKFIVVKLQPKHFDHNHLDILKEVQEHNPQRIYWSNIPDFMTIEDFFKMAKLCSDPKTEHTFHLLNWTTKVFGTSLFDYLHFEKDQIVFQMNEKTQKLYMKLESEFMALIKSDVEKMSAVEVNPKLLDIKDTSEKALCHRYFGGYIHKMFKDITVDCLNWEMEPYSPFSRASTQANVRFKFGKNAI